MNAQEARELALDVKTSSLEVQYLQIQNEIKRYAKDGKFECVWYDAIIIGVRKRLEAEHFKIETCGGRNEYNTTISW